MNPLQLKASNPEISTWVSASAGTGKTKILTDRVLRLLLGNAAFNKILCLTFTNAAAGEMKERIVNSLAKWSKLNDTELKEELQKTLGRNGSNEELAKAKILYELYLRSDENINIQTIHSFCQALLKKFPLEAGVSPSFKIIDEAKAYSILQQIKKNLLNKPELELINDYLTANFHEITIDEIFTEIVQHKTKFSTRTDNTLEESQELIISLNNSGDHAYQDILKHPVIQTIVGFDISVAYLKNFFLNKDGQKRKRIVPQKIAKPGSNFYENLEQIQNQIYSLDQAERTKHMESYSKLLSILSANIINAYESYKSSKGLLDYDDLIIYSSNLLKSSSAKEWVLYKLDGGIDHLLVDEAQDTSASQWQIIDAMIEEFYAGSSTDSDKNRTVFVVGDEKQSIFSFQGADVTSFAHMNKLLKQKMTDGGKHFEDVNLETSYRSAGEILEVVHQVFDKIRQQMPSLFTATLTELTPFRSKHTGSVELWPLCISDNKNEDFWSITTHLNNADSTKTNLAKKISSYIKDQLASARVLPSTGNMISCSDFMILFRKRDELTHEVIKALKAENIEVTGLDRISLQENLAVLDLLSAAKFALNTEDDLNLAALLKSPLIGLDEQKLYDIATSRKKSSIWQYLKSNDKYNLTDKLSIFIDLFNRSDVSNFFQYIVDILGYRENLNANCGPDSNDAIDELIYACNDFASQESTSIQKFIFWLENYNSSIKRDNSSTDKVKIMTLHASKGLQAPYVILCDTNNIPSNSDRFLFVNGQALSAKNSTYVPDYYKILKDEKQGNAYAEYLRLLYVGMTRAEDHLIICGYQGGRSLPDNCWYQLIRSKLVDIAKQTEDGTLIYGATDINYIAGTNAAPTKTNIEFFTTTAQTSPTFKEVHTSRNIASPLSDRDPMGYGLVFHKILEDSLNAKNLNMMSSHPLITTLDPKSQNSMHAGIKKIIDNKKFNSLIREKDIKTELTLGSNINGKIQIGRIDLLLIAPNEVIIIDYKSDKSPPPIEANIPDSYYQQLLIYKTMVTEIYSTKTIRTMILWLENGSLQEIN